MHRTFFFNPQFKSKSLKKDEDNQKNHAPRERNAETVV